MSNADLMQRVRSLHAKGSNPRQIARSLGVPRSKVASFVRAINAEEEAQRPLPPLLGCWISPGWRRGLAVNGRPDWPDAPADDGSAGLVGVFVAREVRPGRVRCCSYLVDVYCLGVKNVRGPRLVAAVDLPEEIASVFDAFDCVPVPAPLDLAQHLVYGSVDYARGLGFSPAPGFSPTAAAMLGRWTGPSAIEFGRDGKPFYIDGPHDDAQAVMDTLTRSVGAGNFHFLVAAPALRR